MNKISFIITSFSSGGAEHQLKELSNNLVESGFDVEIATFADLPDHYELDKRIIRKRIAPNKNNIIKLGALWLYIFSNKSKKIFCFGQRESLLTLIPILFLRKIFFVGERNTNLGKLSFLQHLKLNFLYKRANYIIPNSYTQGEMIKSNFPRHASKIHIITNFTDINKYVNRGYAKHDVLNICIFARYSEQKNYRRFASALKEIKKLSKKTFHVDWFGNIKYKNTDLNPHYIEFNELIKLYDIEDIISLHDSITDVSTRMNEYDAFCLPSIYEGFSNSISEAISCGLPVIASNVSDNYVMVKDGINGFLFNPLDIDDIKTCLLKFVNLPFEKRKTMARESRRIAENLFDKKTFIDKYLEILSQN